VEVLQLFHLRGKKGLLLQIRGGVHSASYPVFGGEKGTYRDSTHRKEGGYYQYIVHQRIQGGPEINKPKKEGNKVLSNKKGDHYVCCPRKKEFREVVIVHHQKKEKRRLKRKPS